MGPDALSMGIFFHSIYVERAWDKVWAYMGGGVGGGGSLTALDLILNNPQDHPPSYTPSTNPTIWGRYLCLKVRFH